jgi:antirestriction protein ArdC
VLAWRKPWSADHLESRIVRPLRHNGQPYNGINVLMLWAETLERGYTSPTQMTFKQGLELKANVRKGERGSLVVRASKITRSETDGESGESSEREIPFVKRLPMRTRSSIL